MPSCESIRIELPSTAASRQQASIIMAGHVMVVALTILVVLMIIRVSRKRIGILQYPKLKLPPGPPGWPVLGNWLTFRTAGITPKTLREVTARYGDVCLLRMGWTPLVVVSSPEAAREVLATRGQEFASRSRNFTFEATSGGGRDMVFADYGPHWRRMRRISTAPFFSKSTVQRCSRQYWEEEFDILVGDLSRAASSGSAGGSQVILQPRKRIQLAIYNTLYRLAFDCRFESLDDPLYRQIERANATNGRLAQSFGYNVADFFPPLRLFFRRFKRQVMAASIHRRYDLLRDIFLRDRMIQRKSKGPAESCPRDRPGVDFLLDAYDSGEITMDNVLYFLQNMNVAALGTTTAMAKWAIAELVNKPNIQEKLHAELVHVLGKGISITESDIERLPYLQAVVKETLRRRMAVPMLVPHKNEHPTKLMGYDIPAKSRIVVNAWGIAHDPRYWDQPETFLPERFLAEKIEPFGSDFRFLPFGSGRRACPGSPMALVSLALIVGKLVQAFEMLPPPGVVRIDTTEYMGQINYFMAPRLSIIMKPRDQ